MRIIVTSYFLSTLPYDTPYIPYYIAYLYRIANALIPYSINYFYHIANLTLPFMLLSVMGAALTTTSEFIDIDGFGVPCSRF